MPVEVIREKIKNFVTQKETTAPSYISNIFKEFKDVDLILKVLKELLKSDDLNDFINASSFLIITMNNPKYIPNKLNESYITKVEEDYEFFDALNAKLNFDNVLLRQYAIDALGELRYEESLNLLNDIFDTYLINDPSSLPHLIKALINLLDEIPWDKINKIVTNNNYIVRWSFLGVFDLTNLDYDNSYKYLEMLLHDNEIFIKEEANYRINILKAEQTSIEKGEVINHSDKNKPKVCFNEIIKAYHFYMEEAKLYCCDNNELNLFIKFYIEESDSLLNKFRKFKNRYKNC